MTHSYQRLGELMQVMSRRQMQVQRCHAKDHLARAIIELAVAGEQYGIGLIKQNVKGALMKADSGGINQGASREHRERNATCAMRRMDGNKTKIE